MAVQTVQSPSFAIPHRATPSNNPAQDQSQTNPSRPLAGLPRACRRAAPPHLLERVRLCPLSPGHPPSCPACQSTSLERFSLDRSGVAAVADEGEGVVGGDGGDCLVYRRRLRLDRPPGEDRKSVV